MNFIPFNLFLFFFLVFSNHVLALSVGDRKRRGLKKDVLNDDAQCDAVVRVNRDNKTEKDGDKKDDDKKEESQTNDEHHDVVTNTGDQKSDTGDAKAGNEKLDKAEDNPEEHKDASSDDTSGDNKTEKDGDKKDDDKKEESQTNDEHHDVVTNTGDQKSDTGDAKAGNEKLDKAEDNPEEHKDASSDDASINRYEFDKYKREEEEKLKKIANDENSKFEDFETRLASLAENINRIEKTEAKLMDANAQLANIKPVSQQVPQVAVQQALTQQTPINQSGDTNNNSFTKPSYNCLLDCTDCKNSSGKNNFCKKDTCKSYKSLSDYSCDEGFTKCGVFVITNANQSFNLMSSNGTKKNPQSFEIQGAQMNPCVKLLVVPNKYRCNRNSVGTLEQESQKILKNEFISTIVPAGIKFDNVLINASPGTYKICLVQYSNDARLDVSVISSLSKLFSSSSNRIPQLVEIFQAGVITLS